MEAQVAQIAKSSYHQIRNIGKIRSSIPDDACKTLVHALVTSRSDTTPHRKATLGTIKYAIFLEKTLTPE